MRQNTALCGNGLKEWFRSGPQHVSPDGKIHISSKSFFFNKDFSGTKMTCGFLVCSGYLPVMSFKSSTHYYGKQS